MGEPNDSGRDASAAEWSRLKASFLDAVESWDDPSRAPSSPLDELQGASSLLLELLRADAEAGRFLGDAPPEAPFAAVLAPGDVFADCRIVRLAGRGGMGEVYEAIDLGVSPDEQRAPARRVAVKLLADAAADARRRAALRRDADALARLSHPGIARVHRGGLATLPSGAEARPYLVLEFIDGPPLDRFVARELERAGDRAALTLSIGLALTDAMACSHREGVIHRDLKASNVLSRSDGSLAIVDFGIARLVRDEAARSSTITLDLAGVGSLASISPERARGEDAGPREDVWAIGAMLFEIAAGRPAHQFDDRPVFEAMQTIAREPPPRLAALAPRFDRDLATVIDRCLAFDPADRYAHAGEVHAELVRVRDGLAPRARRIGPVGRTWRWSKRHRAVAGALAAVFVVLVGSSIALAVFAANAAAARRLAEERRTMSEAVANGLLFDVSEALVGVPGATSARERLLEIGLEYAEAALAREGELNDASRLALARALVSLGSARIARGVAGEGARLAGEAFARGRDLATEAAAQREPGSMAQAEALGVAAHAGRLAAFAEDSMGGEHADERILDLPESLAEQALAIDPGQREAALALAYTALWRGDLARQRGDWEAGVQSCRDAVALLERRVERAPGDAETMSMLALAHSALAQRLCWARLEGHPVDVLADAERAAEVAVAAAAIDPEPQAQARRWAAQAIAARALRIEQPRRWSEAPARLLDAIAGMEALVSRDVENTQVHRDLTALSGMVGEEFEALASLADSPARRTELLQEAIRSTERCLQLITERMEGGLALAHEAANRTRAETTLVRLRAALATDAPPR